MTIQEFIAKWRKVELKERSPARKSGMSEPPQYGPGNPRPLSRVQTELIWEGKYDEYGNRREVDVAGCVLPLQKVESIDEPRQRAEAQGQLDLWRDKSRTVREKGAEYSTWRNRLIWGDNKLVMASLLEEFKGKIDLIHIDPPFDVGADFTMSVPVGDEKFIDFWAVDFEHADGRPFKHHWQDYRLRKDRSLKLASDCGHRYEDTQPHRICVKVIDTFGCDASILLHVPGAVSAKTGAPGGKGKK